MGTSMQDSTVTANRLPRYATGIILWLLVWSPWHMHPGNSRAVAMK